MAKYCLFASTPRYDNRDAIVGMRHSVVKCFTKLNTARKAARQNRRSDDDGEVQFTLCRGESYCGHSNFSPAIGGRKRYDRKTRDKKQQRKYAAFVKADKKARRNPDYIPF